MEKGQFLLRRAVAGSGIILVDGTSPKEGCSGTFNQEGVSAGFAIYDTMRYIKCDVSTICMGLAASFGAFLLAGGTKGKRMEGFSWSSSPLKGTVASICYHNCGLDRIML